MPEDIKQTETLDTKALLNEMKKLRSDVEMFKELAGKNAIASFEHSKRDKTTRVAKFKIFNDKIVIGWSDLDMSHFNSNAKNALDENILVTVYYLDGTSEVVNYITLDRSNKEITFIQKSSNQNLTEVEIPIDVKAKYNLDKDTLTLPTKFLNR